MLILTGTLLVLATWVFLTAVVMVLGLLVASLLSPRASFDILIRHSIWSGLFVATILIGVCSLVTPLRSVEVGWAFGLAVLVLGGLGALTLRSRPHRHHMTSTRLSKSFWCVLIVLLAGQVYLAVSALGPVTGYDTGLYHLGAVQYSADFSAIPGLANLYGPLGYGSMEFPLAAVLENGPWSVEGYRLLNGLLMGLVALDLVIRVARRRWSPGTFVLIVSVTAAWIPMVALSDFWVTSPSQDSSVLSLTLVAVAYLSDVIGRKISRGGDAVVAVLCALLTWLIRPTMAIFAISLVIVTVGVLASRHRHDMGRHLGRAAGVAVAAGAIGLSLSVLRDYRLSGWLQYPLSIHAFDVPWLAPDPTNLRLATLGFHRDPSNMWEAATGFGWVGAWISRLPRQWETFELAALLLFTVVMVLVVVRSRSLRLHVGAIALITAPSVIAVAAWWFLSPPSFRFSWGPLFTILAVPIGWCLWLLAIRTPRAHWWKAASVLGFAIPLVLVLAYSSLFRLHLDARTDQSEWRLGVALRYSVAPVTQVATQDQKLTDGLMVRVPTGTEQCWSEYPLCSPQFSGTLRLLGKGIQEGFTGIVSP